MVEALTGHAWHAKSQSTATFFFRSNAGFCCHYTIINLVSSSLKRLAQLSNSVNLEGQHIDVVIRQTGGVYPVKIDLELQKPYGISKITPFHWQCNT